LHATIRLHTKFYNSSIAGGYLQSKVVASILTQHRDPLYWFFQLFRTLIRTSRDDIVIEPAASLVRRWWAPLTHSTDLNRPIGTEARPTDPHGLVSDRGSTNGEGRVTCHDGNLSPEGAIQKTVDKTLRKRGAVSIFWRRLVERVKSSDTRATAIAMRDAAMSEVNLLRRQLAVAIGERNEYLRQRNIAVAERNEYLRQRDELLCAKDAKS
jgi:hypothetical protein